MDKLPLFLINAIESACEIYSNISYNVHGDKNRARISIVFENNECKQRPTKSKSTVRRDNKRMADYINLTETNKHISKDVEENRPLCSREHKTNCDTGIMDIDDNNEWNANHDKIPNTNRSTSGFGRPHSVVRNDNTEKRTDIEINSETENTKYEEVNNLTENGSMGDDNKTFEDERKDECDDELNLEENPIVVGTETVLPKIVAKYGKYGNDKLIGKVEGSKSLVVFNSQNKTIYEITSDNRCYDNFMKNVDIDFVDIRGNPYLSKHVVGQIKEMATFAIDNKLYSPP